MRAIAARVSSRSGELPPWLWQLRQCALKSDHPDGVVCSDAASGGGGTDGSDSGNGGNGVATPIAV